MGNVEDDETTLLQLHTRVQGHPSLSKKNIDHKMLLESVKQMARGLSSETPEAVNAAIESVKSALAQMEPLLEAEHDQAQNQIQNQLAEIAACHASTSHGRAVVGALAEDLAAMEACREAVNSATAAEETACTAWRNHAALLSFPPCLVPDSNEEHVFSNAQTLKNWVDDAWPIMFSMRTACADATALVTTETARCSTVLGGYEETYCNHQFSCTLLYACHHHEVEVYNTLSYDSGVAMASRQDQFRTIKQAECIVDLITAAMAANATVLDSSLTSCDDDIDGSHLVLDFPQPEAVPVCEAPQENHPQCPAVELPDSWTAGEGLENPCSVDGQVKAADITGLQIDLASVAAGDRFYPWVSYQSVWNPICGHYFWDNNHGATIVCRMLGFGSGVRHHERTTFTVDSNPVGICNAGATLVAGGGGYSHWGNFGVTNGWCQAGHGIGVSVSCSGTGTGTPTASSCQRARTCTQDGQVRAADITGVELDLASVSSGTHFYPWVSYESSWNPICGHYFWDNDHGAAIVCQMLGFESGVKHIMRTTFTVDSNPVGICNADGTLVNGGGSYSHWGEFDASGGWCQTGQGIGVMVSCSGTNTNARTSSC